MSIVSFAVPFFDFSQTTIILQLAYAVFLGGLVGLERGYRGRPAGIRTYALVSMGAALFTIISMTAFTDFAEQPGSTFDPSRIISNIVVGIGFLGAGLIIFRPEQAAHVQGLTTAAGLWVAAAIGVAVGLKMYSIAIAASLLTIAIFYFLLRLEYLLYKGEHRRHEE